MQLLLFAVTAECVCEITVLFISDYLLLLIFLLLLKFFEPLFFFGCFSSCICIALMHDGQSKPLEVQTPLFKILNVPRTVFLNGSVSCLELGFVMFFFWVASCQCRVRQSKNRSMAVLWDQTLVMHDWQRCVVVELPKLLCNSSS